VEIKRPSVIASKFRGHFPVGVLLKAATRTKNTGRTLFDTECPFASPIGRDGVSNKDGNEQSTRDRRIARQSEDD
jgi:hypothetical protein